MKLHVTIAAILSALLCLSCSRGQDKTIVCHIYGTAEDVSGQLLISEYDGDPRSPLATIDIKEDGTFSGEIEADPTVPLLAELMDGGTGVYCHFFPEKETGLALKGMTPPVLTSYSGKYNKELQKLKKTIDDSFSARQDSLYAQMEAMTPEEALCGEAFQLYTKLNDPDTPAAEKETYSSDLDALQQAGKLFSPKYNEIETQLNKLGKEYHESKINYISARRSLVSFFTLAMESQMMYDSSKAWPEDDYYYKTLSTLLDIYETDYADKFAGHPFHEKIAQLQSNAQMLAGKSHYIDFSLPDQNGAEHKLSDLIGGKIAVIDLWASWCAGCRRHSKALIPLYKKYSDKGFTVVGAARELKDDLAWRAALEKDGYPWVNLLAMEPDHWIWTKYGVANAAGCILLVGRDGIVVSVNPSVEEIEEYIKKNLMN